MALSIFTPHVGIIFFQTVSFLSVFFVLKKYAWSPLLAFIEKEEQASKEAFDKAEKARKSVETLRKRGDFIIARAKKKANEIVVIAQRTKGALIQEGILQADTAKAQKIKEGELVIRQKELELRQELKKETAQLVLHVVQKLIGIQLQEKNQQKVVIQQLLQETAQSLKR